jgi:hypothetical protein
MGRNHASGNENWFVLDAYLANWQKMMVRYFRAIKGKSLGRTQIH